MSKAPDTPFYTFAPVEIVVDRSLLSGSQDTKQLSRGFIVIQFRDELVTRIHAVGFGIRPDRHRNVCARPDAPNDRHADDNRLALVDMPDERTADKVFLFPYDNPSR